MVKWVIGRPINGISLNGLEYVCNSEGYTIHFDSPEEAYEFLRFHKYTTERIENEGIIIKDIDIDGGADNEDQKA